jgi:hypothetical protein
MLQALDFSCVKTKYRTTTMQKTVTALDSKQQELTLILGFRCDADEICALLGFRLLTHEDGTDTLSRNVGTQLPHYAA